MNGLPQIALDFFRYMPSAVNELAKDVARIREAVEKCIGKPVATDTPENLPEKHTTEFDCLAVTKVEVFPFKEGASLGRMKGMASVVINDQLQLRGLRIMDGENGLYVGYPNDPFYKGEDFRSMYFPVTRQLREHIENCVLEKYMEATK